MLGASDIVVVVVVVGKCWILARTTSQGRAMATSGWIEFGVWRKQHGKLTQKSFPVPFET